jgi:glycosyltransferase involved in cell wall biosynthesis
MALLKDLRSRLTDGDKKESTYRSPIGLRSQGDRERDLGNWNKAAELYLEYLNTKPDDFAIWVQRGNCLKEAGDFDTAVEVYGRAITLKPHDADVHLQLGHLMKRTGQVAAAIEWYSRSLELDPAQRYAVNELRALGVAIAPTRRPVRERSDNPILFIDIMDLTNFLKVYTRVTGIQRVVTEIASRILEETAFYENLQFCSRSPDGEELLVFHPTLLRELVVHLNSPLLSRESLDRLLHLLMTDTVSAETRPGDIYLIAGAFWIIEDCGTWLLRMKDRGILIGAYIYDLIPNTHPQFVEQETCDMVNESFIEIFTIGDFFLTISEYVARELRMLLKSELKIAKPVYAVPLAHEPPKSSGKVPNIARGLRSLANQPFVLSVGTLEGRKNHLLLHRAWSSLIRKHGFENVPALVLVGKWGWRIEEFRKLCEKDNFLDGKITVQVNLGDDELAYLYHHCSFTVFPSFVEGWGLPVGESLAVGKPCLASNATSIPEVGGDLVVYFNPHDVFGATEAIEKAMFDRDFLQKLARRIEAEFKPRSWANVADTLVRTVGECTDTLRREAATDSDLRKAAISVESGKLHEINTNAAGGRAQLSWPQRVAGLVRYAGWHRLENWGSWSKTPRAELRLAIGVDHPVRTATVYLELRLPPNVGSTTVIVSDGQRNSLAITSLGLLPKWVRCPNMHAADGLLQIFVEIPTIAATEMAQDDRRLFVGLSGIGYHVDDNVNSRLDIIEELLTKTLSLCGLTTGSHPE